MRSSSGLKRANEKSTETYFLNSKDSLETLSKQELEQLSARIQYELGRRKSTSQKSDHCPLLLEAISAALKKLGGQALTPASVAASSLKNSYSAGHAVVAAYVEKHFKPKSRPQTFLAYSICVEAIIVSIKAIPGVPISPKTICDRLVDVAGHVDSSFPGYAEAGLLPIALKASRPA